MCESDYGFGIDDMLKAGGFEQKEESSMQRDNLLESTKNLLDCFKKSLDCSADKCEACHRSSISVHGICRAASSAITSEEARQAAWIANGKKPSRSLENFSLVTGVPMDQLERYLGGKESVKLSAYRGALEAFKREALCNCESSGKACLLCFERNPNEHNLCTSLRNLIEKLEKKEEDK